MADVLRAMSIAGGLLLLIVVLVVIVSFAAVKRGEVQMGVASSGRRVWWDMGPQPAVVAPGGAGIGAKPAGADISVLEILLLGAGLFTLAVLGLLGLSVLEHL